MSQLLGKIDQAAPLASLRQPEPRLCSDLAWACGQGYLSASRRCFRRADGAQLSCLSVSIAACSTQSEHGVPGSIFPRVEGQSTCFVLGLCLEAQPGSVPSSSGLGVTGFLWCASAKSQRTLMPSQHSGCWSWKMLTHILCCSSAFLPCPPLRALCLACVPQFWDLMLGSESLQPQTEQLELNHSSSP